MGKQKVPTADKRCVLLRMPRILHDRLIRVSADRSIKEGRSISINRLIVEAVEKQLN